MALNGMPEEAHDAGARASHLELQNLLEILRVHRAASFSGRDGAVELHREPPFPTGVVEDLQDGREIHAAASHLEEIAISKLNRGRNLRLCLLYTTTPAAPFSAASRQTPHGRPLV